MLRVCGRAVRRPVQCKARGGGIGDFEGWLWLTRAFEAVAGEAEGRLASAEPHRAARRAPRRRMWGAGAELGHRRGGASDDADAPPDDSLRVAAEPVGARAEMERG